MRALFDLWVDAAEEAYADAALSPEYRGAYGALVNAQMRLRADAQAIAEQAAQLAGMPSRSELDGAHRKIAELERQLRRLQRAGKDEAATTPAPERTSPSKPATPTTTRASRPAAAKRAPAKKPAGAVRAPAKKSASASRTSMRTSAKTAGTTSKSPKPRRPAKPAKPTARKR